MDLSDECDVSLSLRSLIAHSSFRNLLDKFLFSPP